MQFGLGSISSTAKGVVGIGYPRSEAYVDRVIGQPYPNLPQLLQDQGIININAYSLWLNDRRASSGSLLFGGVDTAKFHGNLTTFPIQAKNNGLYENFLITLSDLRLSSPTGPHGFPSSPSILPAAVLLNSGSTSIAVPKALVTDIYSALNVVKQIPATRLAYVDCGLGQESLTLDFAFGTATISVPMDELVQDPIVDDDGAPLTLLDGTRICRLGIVPTRQPGGPLVVYDLSRNEISNAPTNFNPTTASNVIEIAPNEHGDEKDLDAPPSPPAVKHKKAPMVQHARHPGELFSPERGG